MEFENSNKLKGYLSNESKRLGIHSNQIYTIYFIRRFLEKLYRIDKNNFVIKGSVAQLANTKTFTRPVTDIDTVSSIDTSESSNMIEKIIDLKEDPIKHKVLEKFVTDSDTVCLKILCSFDRIEHMIRLDLKQEESKRFVTSEVPIVLRKDNPLTINNTLIEKAICDKIYIILKQAELNIKGGKKIRRFKDYYDLYNMITLADYDINLVKDFFQTRCQTEGPIDLNIVNSYLEESDILSDNELLYKKDQIKFAFLLDLTFEELSKTSRLIIEDTLGKRK